MIDYITLYLIISAMFFMIGVSHDIKKYVWVRDSLTFLIIINIGYGLLWPIAIFGQFFPRKGKVVK